MTTGTVYVEKNLPEEIAALFGEWRRSYPDMGVLALVAESDRETLVPLLQDVCRRMTIPLRGAVFPALIVDAGFRANGCLLLRFDGMPFTSLYDSLSPAHPEYEGTIRRMSDDVIRHLGPSRGGTLCMLFDSMIPTIATILDEMYLTLADRVRYMGANAGSETFQPMPCLFDNDRQVDNGALLMLLPDHHGAVTEHCYQAPERMISATSTDGNRIISIDWRPAFEVYQEVVQAEYNVAINRDNFYQLAVHFPFGLMRANNEIVVRIPVALEEDGSVFCVGEVPPNALLTLLQAPAVDSSRTVEKLAAGLRALSGELTGSTILTFYCAGRRIHLGDRAENELVHIQQATAAVRVAGALSLGEIGYSMQGGYPSFHNGAVVCCTWGSHEP
jgi:hypothetical protein